MNISLKHSRRKLTEDGKNYYLDVRNKSFGDKKRLRVAQPFCYDKRQKRGKIMFNELTQKDIDDMKAEVEYRKCVVRKELLEDVKTARAHGDLSENFEYKAAKQAKNQNESRIRYLEKMIKTAVVISGESKEDEVGLNKIVELYFEEDDEVEEFKVVTTVRGNSLKNLISTESPIGKAVLGHKVGERVWVEINANAGYYVEIKSIKEADSEEKLRSF